MVIKGFVLASDSHKVHYEQYKNGHKDVIIIAHGFYTSKQAVLFRQLARDLNKYYDVVLFDFRGHGQSQGLFYWTSKEYLDLLAVVEFFESKYAKIGLIGFSMGAATSIIAASKTTKVHSIISVSGPAEIGRIDYHFWKLRFDRDLFYNWFGIGSEGKGVKLGPFWHKKEKPVDVVKTMKTPILYIHGDMDWVVLPWHSHELYASTPGFKRLEIIKKGPHAEFLFKDHGPQMLGLVKDWFNETLH